MAGEERRRYPRVQDKPLSVELKLGSFDTITHTLNVSASGVYCKIDKEIPLMSRVKVVMMIPDFLKDYNSMRNVEVSGVVVREHPVIIDGVTKHYDVAIFFDDLSESDRGTITHYLSKKDE